MALLANAISLPFIILFSLPLFFTAIFTTSLALSTLFIRGSIVYVEYSPYTIPPPPALTTIDSSSHSCNQHSTH